MFAGLAIPITLETARRNPVREPVRNLVLTTGDDTTFAISVYEPDGSPTDISGSAVTLTVTTAPMDPGSHGWGYGNGYGYGGAGYDYGLGWLTCRDRIVFQTYGDLTDPCCGQATLTLPREATANWRGRYRLLFSLDSPDGGCVQSVGVLDVRHGAYVPRLGSAGYVSIMDAVVAPIPHMTVGILDNVGIVDGTVISFVPNRIGIVAPPVADGFPMLATFIVTLAGPAKQTVIVRYQTYDDTAMAGTDYTAASGTVTFAPGDVTQSIVVAVRPYDPSRKQSQFTMRLRASNGAILVQPCAVAVVPGWVGFLDALFVVDGTTAPFVPGLVGVQD